MKNFLIRLFVNSFALSAAAWMVGGVHLTGTMGQILFVALIFGVLNSILKPILMFLSLPFIVVTLGFFALLVNGALLLMTAGLTDSLQVDGWVSAVLGAIVISVVSMIMNSIVDEESRAEG